MSNVPDLFNNVDVEKVIQFQIEPYLRNWTPLFNKKDLLLLLDKINKYKKINERYDQPVLFPLEDDLFRIYQDLDPRDVKVVILGNGPKFDGGSDGLAFSNSKAMTPTLLNIYSSILRDLNTQQKTVLNHSLHNLLSQGVFLLNANLTTSNKLGHNIFWNDFTEATVSLLNREYENIVFCLWGNTPVNYTRLINTKKHLVLRSASPERISKGSMWLCDHFSKTNEYLILNNKQPIDWLKSD